MKMPLYTDRIQGIDLVIDRFQDALNCKFPDWEIYPRLESHSPRLYKTEGYTTLGTTWDYYLGNGSDYKQINFAEVSNTIGFGIQSLRSVNRLMQATMVVLVSYKNETLNRNMQMIENEVQQALLNTYQTTSFRILDIVRRDVQKRQQPYYYFNINIEANYIPSYIKK